MFVLQPPPPAAAPAPSPPAEVPRDPAHPARPGHVTLKCHVTPQGGVDRCAVAEETPGGAGLAEAAIRIAAKMHLKPPAGGASARDGLVTLPMTFKVPAGPPPS